MMRALLLLCWVLSLSARELIEVDFTKTAGELKPLNGVNKGPLAPGGLIDLSADFKKLRIPYVRLHDCQWPNPDVVDMHVVFPDAKADPAEPASYSFASTDEYLLAIQAVGAQIIYRLGESIEHTTRKRFVHPPADPGRWTQAALGIIRHYNEGWASGFRLGIQYWEIWNEPENRPVMWSGTDEDYINLYRVSAKAIKSAYPGLKVGGPALGSSGSFKNGQFVPTAFLKRFLEACRDEKLPLDFFSWHCYTDRPQELVDRARAIRALLDRYGFNRTENHLNEWNYLPGNDWKPVMRGAAAKDRERFYAQMSGSEGAAFFASAVLQLQDAPLDLATFFHGELGGFGLFNEFGVPNATFGAFTAIGDLSAGKRAAVRASLPALASATRVGATLVVANWTGTNRPIRIVAQLPEGDWKAESELIGISRPEGASLKPEGLEMDLPPRSAAVVRFTID